MVVPSWSQWSGGSSLPYCVSNQTPYSTLEALIFSYVMSLTVAPRPHLDLMRTLGPEFEMSMFEKVTLRIPPETSEPIVRPCPLVQVRPSTKMFSDFQVHLESGSVPDLTATQSSPAL